MRFILAIPYAASCAPRLRCDGRDISPIAIVQSERGSVGYGALNRDGRKVAGHVRAFDEGSNCQHECCDREGRCNHDSAPGFPNTSTIWSLGEYPHHVYVSRNRIWSAPER